MQRLRRGCGGLLEVVRCSESQVLPALDVGEVTTHEQPIPVVDCRLVVLRSIVLFDDEVMRGVGVHRVTDPSIQCHALHPTIPPGLSLVNS